MKNKGQSVPREGKDMSNFNDLYDHVAADRTQGSADERVIPITLNIKPGATVSEQEPYFLYARNCDIGTVDTLRELRMRIAFAPSFDFGW